MTEDFETILKAGSAEVAARIAAPPPAAVRVRGDLLRRRRRATRTTLAAALVAAVGGGIFAVAGPSSGDAVPPADVAPGPSRTTDGTGHTTNAPPPTSPGGACRSLVVPPEVKAAVTAAYRRSQPDLVHIAPLKGTFYYGRCGATFYAGASFTPTAGATEREQVALTDYGSAEKYFTKPPNSAWTYVASDGFPRSPRGCAALKEIPAALAARWADCLHH